MKIKGEEKMCMNVECVWEDFFSQENFLTNGLRALVYLILGAVFSYYAYEVFYGIDAANYLAIIEGTVFFSFAAHDILYSQGAMSRETFFTIAVMIGCQIGKIPLLF
ncbi:MAG: hypothetical protein ACOZBL_04355 [Patescibacteria group bacterium]